MSRKVAWGVLGTAKIGTENVIPAMQRGELSTVAAIASRDGSRARAVADKLGIPRAYGSYEELLADPAIEAIYNPLPNHLHVPWTLKALEAGKHVLCEKPVALDAEEAATAGRRRRTDRKLVAEAFMVRHHPQWRTAREHRARRAHRRGARDPDVLLLLPHRPREHPQPGRHRRRRALRHRLLRRSSRPATSSAPSPSA